MAAMGVPNRAEKAAQKVSDAASQLQGRALASCGAAEQMGQNGGNEDQRRCLQWNLTLCVDRVQHHIGAAPLLLPLPLIHPDNQDSREGQSVENPGVLHSEGSCHRYALSKGRSHQSQGYSGQGREYQPLNQND